MDKLVEQLFSTAEQLLEIAGDVSPMVLGSKGEEEQLALVLPSDTAGTDEGMVRFAQAVMLCLFAGCDHIYEMRNVVSVRVPEGEEGNVVSPSEDPSAFNGIQVMRTNVVDKHTDSWMWEYGVTDSGGRPFMELVEGHGVGGRYQEIVEASIDSWGDTGVGVGTLGQVDDMRRSMGLIGGVRGHGG